MTSRKRKTKYHKKSFVLCANCLELVKKTMLRTSRVDTITEIPVWEKTNGNFTGSFPICRCDKLLRVSFSQGLFYNLFLKFICISRIPRKKLVKIIDTYLNTFNFMRFSKIVKMQHIYYLAKLKSKLSNVLAQNSVI